MTTTAAAPAPTQTSAAPQGQSAATVLPDPPLEAGWKSCGRVVLRNTSMPVSANSSTTCDFALNTVRDAEAQQSATVEPYSPALRTTVLMNCELADGVGLCNGGNNAAVGWSDGPPTPN